MLECISVENMRLSDAMTIEKYVPSLELMHRAAMGVFRATKWYGKVAIVVGSGNNGGDGYVTARRLAKEGADVSVITFNGLPNGQAAYGMYSFTAELGLSVIDANENMDKCLVTVIDADVIVDAAYGFGFHGELPPVLAQIFDTVSKSGGAKVAIDVPSGIECDSGFVAPHTAHADITVTFISHKICHVLYPSAGYCGKVLLTDIGIPKSCYLRSKIGVIGDEYVKAVLPSRPDDGHKGTFGTVYTVCGSYSYSVRF